MLRRQPHRRPIHGAVAGDGRRVRLALHEHHRMAGLDVGGRHGDAEHAPVGDALVQAAPGDDRAHQLGQGPGVEQAARAAGAGRAEQPAQQPGEVAPAAAEDLVEPQLLPRLGQVGDAKVGNVVVRRGRAGVDGADAGAAKDARPGGVAQPRREVSEHVAQDAHFIRAARAASGEDQRQRRIGVRHAWGAQKRKSRPPLSQKACWLKALIEVGPVPLELRGKSASPSR